MRHGIDEKLIRILGDATKSIQKPITYAGGIATFKDIEQLELLSDSRLNFTVGSGLDLYGGSIPYKELVKLYG